MPLGREIVGQDDLEDAWRVSAAVCINASWLGQNQLCNTFAINVHQRKRMFIYDKSLFNL